MDAEAINVSQGSRNTTRSKQVHQSVNPLGVVHVKVPKHGVVWHIGLRMSLVTAVHGRKLDRVTDEEDRKVVEDKVLDTILGIKLCRPASNVANRVARPLFATYS